MEGQERRRQWEKVWHLSVLGHQVDALHNGDGQHAHGQGLRVVADASDGALAARHALNGRGELEEIKQYFVDTYSLDVGGDHSQLGADQVVEGGESHLSRAG